METSFYTSEDASRHVGKTSCYSTHRVSDTKVCFSLKTIKSSIWIMTIEALRTIWQRRSTQQGKADGSFKMTVKLKL